ncbi:hypothetical protein ACQJBY_035533 [Aegilops geniculata]
MDSGDARKESIEGSDAMSLQGAGNSQHNHVEEVISHNKPKKDANLHVIPQETNDLECLIKNDMFLHDGVINAYIYCMLAHENLQDRAGEKVHIISTFVSGQIKEDGKKDIDPSKYRRIVRHVNSYLQQDMLFIPINMPGYHWYLAVANAKKREIQVLDSLGENVKRDDLATTLLGLEKWLKLAEHSPEFINGHKWPDLNVTKWTVVEQIQEAIQTDG